MTAVYARQIATAADVIARKGAPVAFARGQRTYDPATDRWSGTGASATASALRVKSNPTILAALTVQVVQPITLLVESGSLGAFVPVPADQMVFAGVSYRIVDVEPLAPDGTSTITYRIIGSR